MKILILGGTGAMGVHLVELLKCTNRYEIHVTSRSQQGYIDNVTYIKGNAKNKEFIRNILKNNWDIIVDFMVYTTLEFQDVSRVFLESCSQYIYLSSARVYADCENFITEESPRLLDVVKDAEYLKTDEYALSKARQENHLFDSSLNNWTIIRPYITYGKNRLQFGTLEKESWLYRAMKNRTVLFSETIFHKETTLTSGFDVASGIISLINKTSALGEVFHITSNYSMKWGEVFGIYKNIFDINTNSELKLKLQTDSDFLKWNNGKYQIIHDRMYNRKFDNKKINEFIDTSKFINPEVGLAKCFSEFIKTPEYGYINWKSEALKDKILNCNTSLSEITSIKQKINYILNRHIL
ncbi:NAD-dependent epimerase/dehydratase family protein [Vibrio alginolyticus]|uniref:NAD-dependent epimerase/dehydratase family protein n=1 Tax=Vibrio chagasii TaxID=170679 RepID=UPI001EFD72D8|nr:NAD-dependent epimerase/dehydratase family protein [Vibrio chagasii]MCG9606873.1 NAD-dependent epimerase/dehydratase family protein [Vibrio chagasii]MDE9382888.1 NAD-dependent epimerase/dehydratase family protein [Vibrio alginolyticus]